MKDSLIRKCQKKDFGIIRFWSLYIKELIINFFLYKNIDIARLHISFNKEVFLYKEIEIKYLTIRPKFANYLLDSKFVVKYCLLDNMIKFLRKDGIWVNKLSRNCLLNNFKDIYVNNIVTYNDIVNYLLKL